MSQIDEIKKERDRKSRELNLKTQATITSIKTIDDLINSIIWDDEKFKVGVLYVGQFKHLIEDFFQKEKPKNIKSPKIYIRTSQSWRYKNRGWIVYFNEPIYLEYILRKNKKEESKKEKKVKI